MNRKNKLIPEISLILLGIKEGRLILLCLSFIIKQWEEKKSYDIVIDDF
jgi:hypothetical protein